MEELSKAQLEQMLKELREKKSDQRIYHNSSIWNEARNFGCYFVPYPRYYCRRYSGKHVCQSCGKEFGENLHTLISECKKERYLEYCDDPSGSLMQPGRPCFSDLLTKVEKEREVVEYLAEHDLTLSVKTIDITPKSSDRKRFKTEYVFNRKLTYKEWSKLNTGCYCGKNERGSEEKGRISPCFKEVDDYRVYRQLVKQFKKAGVEAQLKYNCDDCCEKDKNEFEFWLKVDGKQDYVISYPNSNCTYKEYMIALKFLKGNCDYLALIKDDEFESEGINKMDIDCALNKIIGLDISYDKAELCEIINGYFSHRILLHPQQESIKEAFQNYLENIPDNKTSPEDFYQFTLSIYHQTYWGY